MNTAEAPSIRELWQLKSVNMVYAGFEERTVARLLGSGNGILTELGR